MKRKLLFGFMALALICSSCKKDNDVMDTIVNLGDQNMRAMYSVQTVDTASMLSSVTQYVLDKKFNKGSLNVVSAGNKAPLKTNQTLFIWRQNGINPGTLRYDLDVEFAVRDYVATKMEWAHGILYDAKGNAYPSSLIDIYTSFQDIYSTFVPLTNEWNHKDSTIHCDTIKITIPCLKWEQDKKNWTQSKIDEQRAYFAQQWVKDTIAWYNEKFDKHVPDTIRVVKEVSGGKFEVVYPKSKESSYDDVSFLYVGNATENFITARFDFDASSRAQSFSYYAWKAEYSKDYYKNKTATTATSLVMTEEMKNVPWVLGIITNAKKFQIVTKGQLFRKKTTRQAGAVTEFTHTQNTVAVTHQIESFATKDSTMTLDGSKMKYVR